ncbi:AGAP006252-PA-like protein [Anopheles sinensis]|uniref:AGAP006252-PA-like protein n=1 Tax=Anopheles sinensis TaxID=74873 RepID=A0A084VDH5_ANOSI|nr:AGAP006252-PA-like protein [Anopheles sinensis]
MWARCLFTVAIAAVMLVIAYSQDCTGPHEEYFNCASPCQRNCSNLHEIVESCRESCVSGCFCMSGYFRQEGTLECVRPWTCTKGVSKRKKTKLSRKKLEY